MTTKLRRKTDPLEHEVELALQPGAFIPDRASFSFTSGLRKAAAMLASLTRTEPARATSLYEAFYAGCLEKAEEVDDSSGSFGHFAGELLCGWVKGRQALRADADETSTRLLARMDHDPYGFCYHFEELDQQTPSGTTARSDLARLRRELLIRLGRGTEALAAAWSRYVRSPGKYTYAELMRCVGGTTARSDSCRISISSPQVTVQARDPLS